MNQINQQFAVRIASVNSNIPDGMFLKSNGRLTDSKVSAKVFDSVDEAELWFVDLKKTDFLWSSKEGNNLQVWVIPVVTKTVIKQALKTPVKQLS